VATPDILAGTIMDSAAALLNDAQKQVYTYAAQIPYLKIALKELREWMELSNAPITDKVTTILNIPAGTLVVGFATTPALPVDLIEIQELWERQADSESEAWVPMVRKEFLPHYLDGQDTNRFQIWAWNNNQIELLASNIENDLKLDYIRTLFTSVVDQNSTIGMINCDSFLHYRIAALCAEFTGENMTRAQSLNQQAQSALDRLVGIDSKGKQQISTRHRPFRATFKSRGLW
jgi:hypothetical protein